jgi:DNA primase small subunit
MSQADDIKPEPEPEPETQDATMDDAPSPPAPADKSKASLEALFDDGDDDDSEGEFASSAPIKSEEDASQPEPVYAQYSSLRSVYSPLAARSPVDRLSPTLKLCALSTSGCSPSATYSNG